MKKISVVWISLIFLLTAGTVKAQVINGAVKQIVITPSPLQVTYSKTTNLLFPYAIKSVDKGSKDLLAQIANGVENILQVKAGKQGFPETNLTVVTAEGKFYSYLVNYTENPVALNIKVGNNINYPHTDALFTYKTDNEAKVYDITEKIASKQPILKGIKDDRNDIELNLSGLYIKEDKLYFQFQLENNSEVDYNIEALRFYIKDKKRAKRTAAQEIEQLAVEQSGNVEIIRGKSLQTIVIVIPRFTIPDKKILMVELMEMNGGRHLNLKIKNKTILSASGIQ